MVKRAKNESKRSIFTEKNDLSVVNPLSPSFNNSTQKPNSLKDDLIVVLSDSHENKRARQVVEWEQMQKQSLHGAA